MFNENLTLFKSEHDKNTRNIRRVDESEDVKNGAKGKEPNMAQPQPRHIPQSIPLKTNTRDSSFTEQDKCSHL